MIHLLDAPIAPQNKSENIDARSSLFASETIHSVTSDDGRIWGPFTSLQASKNWIKFYSTHRHRIFTARDLYEGAIQGDAISLISASAFEFGTHPFTEIYDFLERHDNGRVVLDLPSSTKAVAANTVVLVDRPMPSHRIRHLPSPITPPEYANIRFGIKMSIPAKDRGEIVIFEDDKNILVGWRPDTRHTRDIKVLSQHDFMEAAESEARQIAKRFDPPARGKSNRIRDYQRELVYRWEWTFDYKNEQFNTIDECRAYADQVCEELGVKEVPIKAGPSNLETHSYFSATKGIVLASHMMNSGTIIHELAHYVVKLDRKVREASHGPTFVGTLAAMYAKFLDADLDEAFLSARNLGIDCNEEKGRELFEKMEEKSSFKP